MYLTIQIQPQQSAQQSVHRKCGMKGGPIQSVIMITITAAQGLQIWIEVGQSGSPVSYKLTDWVSNNYINVEWSFVFDSQTAAMQIPVLFVSVQVQIYSQGYMVSDPHKNRFFSYQSIFTFFMQIQITGENLLVQFVGWEGVGQASYQQVNFWFTRVAANMAAQKAFLLNRVGDWGLCIAQLLSFSIQGDVSFDSIQSMGLYLNTDIVQIISILFQIGASAKSAQLGQHNWLANAMEGPTPVSSLIHAATMVTVNCRFIQKQIKSLYRYILEKTIKRFLQTSQIELQKKILVFQYIQYIKNGFNQQVTFQSYIFFHNFNTMFQYNDRKETSETTRDITKFNFESYKEVKPSHKKIINKRFLEWFIGFTEGDGSFITFNGKPSFDITKNMTDIQIIKNIRTSLGFGKILIRDEPDRNVGVFYVTGKENFERQIHIFNGNICSKQKQKQFEQWVNSYNIYYNENMRIMKKINTFSLNDSWLSGFIDAEGCFETRYIKCKTSKQKERPRQIFSISQKDEEILIKIRNIIQTSFIDKYSNNQNVNYDKSWEGNRYKTENKKDQITIMNYIQTHKQKTKKNINYLKWRNVLNQMRKGIHLTKKGNSIINDPSRLQK